MRLDSETGFLATSSELQNRSWNRLGASRHLHGGVLNGLGGALGGFGQLSGHPKLMLDVSCELFGASNRSRIGFKLILEAKMDVKI